MNKYEYAFDELYALIFYTVYTRYLCRSFFLMVYTISCVMVIRHTPVCVTIHNHHPHPQPPTTTPITNNHKFHKFHNAKPSQLNLVIVQRLLYVVPGSFQQGPKFISGFHRLGRSRIFTGGSHFKPMVG